MTELVVLGLGHVAQVRQFLNALDQSLLSHQGEIALSCVTFVFLHISAVLSMTLAKKIAGEMHVNYGRMKIN